MEQAGELIARRAREQTPAEERRVLGGEGREQLDQRAPAALDPVRVTFLHRS
jgi:hypothetical protein